MDKGIRVGTLTKLHEWRLPTIMVRNHGDDPKKMVENVDTHVKYS